MKRRIFNIKGKRLVEGDANLTNQDEILVKELQDNRVALLENIDGKLVNIGGLEEEKKKRPEIVDTVVKVKQHLIFMSDVYEEVEEINLFLGKRNILQYKFTNSYIDRYIIHLRGEHGNIIMTHEGQGSYLNKHEQLNDPNKCFILTPYISNDTFNVAIEVAKDGYYELENVLDSNGEKQLIQIRDGYCVTPFGGGVKPMRFKYPLQDETLRIWRISGNRTTTPESTSSICKKYLHVLFKKNPLFTFDSVDILSELSDEELKNHLISVKACRQGGYIK